MKLSNRDAELIAKTSMFADEPLPDLARRAGVKNHTLRYVLSRLIGNGILKKRWIIDLLGCGWGRYEIFFSSSIASKKDRDAFVTGIKQSEFVTYFAEVSGDFDYELILLARSSLEAMQKLSELTRLHESSSFSKAVVHHQQVHYFPRKHLAPTAAPREVRSLVSGPLRFELQELDHNILKHLSSDPDISHRALARLCDCAPLTIQSHFEKLKKAGIIRGAIYSVQGSSLGLQNFLFLLHTKRWSESLRKKLLAFCADHHLCTNVKECFGGWDYEIGIEVSHHQDVSRFKAELLERFAAELQNVKLFSRFEVHKYGLYPFQKFQSIRNEV